MGWLSRLRPHSGEYNFDSPAPDVAIATPDIHVRGWFALPKDSRVTRTELIGQGGNSRHSQIVRLCERDDAQRVHPDLRVVGIDQRVVAEPFTDGSGFKALLRFHCGRDYYEFPVERAVTDSFASTDGYYSSADHLADGASTSAVLTDAQRQHWQENGFVVLKGLFDNAAVAGTHALIDDLWAQRQAADFDLSIDVYSKTEGHHRVAFGEAPDSAREQTYKLNDLFVTHAAIRDLILHTPLAAVIGDLLDGEPVVCNTLYFEYGSQQDDHFDTFYMPPTIRNKMLATWIAFDSANETNGSLRYYPGSHKIDPYVFSNGMFNETTEELPACMDYIRKELDRRGIKPVVFHAEPGDVFIWHAHLLHGGSEIIDPGRTRRSLVTHYYRTCDLDPGAAIEHTPGCYYMNRPPAPVTLPSHRRLEFEKQISG